MKISDLFEGNNNSSIIDNKNGWGAVPNNQEVDYLGLRVTMTPNHFIDLAAPLGSEPSDKIAQHLEQGGTIGSPFLQIEIPESWEDGDFTMPARVMGHEGRNRMAAVAKVFGNNPVETHLFFNKGLRNRHITDEFKKNLNRGLVKEKSKSIIRGPFFSLSESIKEDGRIIKGVNTTADVGPNEIKRQAAKFGNTVDKDGYPPAMSKAVKGSSTNVLYNLGLAERYTPMEIACIEGGHCLEDLKELRPSVPKKPGRLFASLTEKARTKNEAFDTDVEWIKGAAPQGASVFAAKVDDAYIEITYKPMNKGVYISFTRGARMSVTGEGSQNKIFGAVINHIKKWVDANKPQEIYFSAFKPRTGAFGSQDTTRSGLYRKMVQRFASQNGYDYDVEDGGNEDTFILKRKENNTQTTEALDQPYPVRWSVKNDEMWYGHAKEDDFYNQMGIEIKSISEGRWSIRFKVGDKMDKTGEGDEFRIFATVKTAIQQWWAWASKNAQVNQITFSAEKIVDTSRSRLYNRFAQQFARTIGYDMEVVTGRATDIFYLKKPGLEENFADGVNEGPKDFADMQLDNNKIQQELDYFYTDHAPVNIGGRKDAGSFKGLNIVTFTKGKDTLMFLVNKDDQAVFYVAYRPAGDGVAIGNVRSNSAVRATEVYAYLVDKFGTLYSDSKQTTQGRKIWTDLAKFYPNLKITDVGNRLKATNKVEENFADGKKPGRKGLAKRSGVNTKASVSSLRKTAKNSSGEKQRMAHWLANMKAGKAKKK